MFVETLTSAAYELLKAIGRLELPSAFYLAGGSAAALHLGHRVSIDLDFFTQDPAYDMEAMLRALSSIGRLDVRQQAAGTLIGTLQQVQTSFFVYPYPLLRPPKELEKVRIADLYDIALMKIIAITQRGTRRDFIDLYFICRSGIKLAVLLEDIAKKYHSIHYPAYHVLRSLAYFADAEKDAPPRSLAAWDWEQIKLFFEAEVRGLMGRLGSE